MSRKRTSDIIWADGRPRQPPKADEDLARRLAQNPKALLDGPPLAWLKRKLEMVPPDWIGSELPASTPQKIIEHNEVDVGQEAQLDFQDTDLSVVKRGIKWDVANVVGVRDIVSAIYSTVMVNPGDIEIDPLLADLIDLSAGRAGFSVTGTSLSPIFDSALNYCGRTANFTGGFSIEAMMVLSNIVYADNVQIAFKRADDAAGTVNVASMGSLSFDLPGTAAYNGTYATGWKTIYVGTGWGGASDKYLFLQAGGEPYLDIFPATFTGTVYYRWKYDPDGDGALAIDLPHPASGGNTTEQVPVWNPTTGEWEIGTPPPRQSIRLNSAGSVYERSRINVIEGTGVDVSFADDSTDDEIDLTVAVDPTEISVTAFAFPGGTGTFLRGDGTFDDVPDRLNAAFQGEPIVGGGYPVVIPRGTGDADITIDLERFALRLETPASSGDTVAVLQKATGGGAPAWTDVATCTITAGNYEATEQTIGAYTITSGDLLRVYFTSVGTGADYYTATVTGTEV